MFKVPVSTLCRSEHVEILVYPRLKGNFRKQSMLLNNYIYNNKIFVNTIVFIIKKIPESECITWTSFSHLFWCTCPSCGIRGQERQHPMHNPWYTSDHPQIPYSTVTICVGTCPERDKSPTSPASTQTHTARHSALRNAP